MKEAAAQGYVDVATAAAFTSVSGVKPQALKHRLKTTARTRITPGQMRLPVRRARATDVTGPPRLRPAGDLASSGCRVSEVVALTANQMTSRTGRFVLQVLGKNQTVPREAPLSQEAYMLIEAWLARRPLESAYLFTSFAGRGHVAPSSP